VFDAKSEARIATAESESETRISRLRSDQLPADSRVKGVPTLSIG
jgi:hypothetical protein